MALAVGLVLALVAGGGAAALLVLSDDQDAGAPAAEPAPATGASTPAPPPAPAAAPGEVDQVVADLSAFVGEQRGLPFRQAVAVELLADEEFVERLLEDFEDDRDELELAADLLVAVGLVEPGVDLVGGVRRAYAAGVVGFYDNRHDELVVRGSELTPFVRSVLVHELVHALDDQHFELHRPALEEADDESALAFAALVEGNAVRIQERFERTLSAPERAEARYQEMGYGAAGADVPPVVLQMLAFPYLSGPAFVRTLEGAGGEEAVNAAFGSPPVTTEHILEPASYRRGEGPRPVEAPAADGSVIDEGAYGQWALQITLAQAVGPTRALEATQGWGGDRYVAWRQAERTCVRARVAMDDRAELAELIAALHVWASPRPAATVEPEHDAVVFTSCG